MNIALGTLVIFFLLVPGFAYLSAYHSGKYSRKYIQRSLFDDFTLAVIPSLIIHAFLAGSLFKGNVSFSSLGYLLIGTTDNEIVKKIFEENISNHIWRILGYFIFSGLIGLIFGACFAWIIRRCRWDVTTDFFRFNNYWHYILSGEYIAQSPSPSLNFEDLKNNKVSLVATIDCNINEELITYKGVVYQYFLNKDGLDGIYLYEDWRKVINNTEHPGPGFLLIPAKSIYSISLDPFRASIKRDPNGDQVSTPPIDVDVSDLEENADPSI